MPELASPESLIESLPAEVAALGEPTSIYTGSRLVSIMCLVIGIGGGIVLVGIFTGAGIATGELWRATIESWLIFASVFAFAVLTGGILTVTGLRLPHLRIAVCPGGIARVRTKGVDILSWNGLQLFARLKGSPIGNKYTFWLRNGDQQWRLDYRIAGVDDLGEAINRELVRRELPGLLVRVNRGEEVEFGPLRVSQDELGYKAKRLSWQEIAEIGDFLNGNGDRQFRVLRPGNAVWCSVSAQTVPNYVLLFDLIGEIQPRIQTPA